MRFITMEGLTSGITAYSENEDWKTAVENPDIQEWVWQEAPDKTTAIAQHITKHDEWYDDQNTGRPEKDTY